MTIRHAYRAQCDTLGCTTTCPIEKPTPDRAMRAALLTGWQLVHRGGLLSDPRLACPACAHEAAVRDRVLLR